MGEQFDIESLVHLEQTFYEAGYQDGFEHGRIHGLIEGRALGRAKGFEMWEELGFYEGFALMWHEIYAQQARAEDRATNHIKRLLELIYQFPKVNPSTADRSSNADIPKLFRQIRSRYRALCSVLGVRPSLRYSEKSQDREKDEDDVDADVDDISRRSEAAKTVWHLENGAPRHNIGHALDF